MVSLGRKESGCMIYLPPGKRKRMKGGRKKDRGQMKSNRASSWLFGAHHHLINPQVLPHQHPIIPQY